MKMLKLARWATTLLLLGAAMPAQALTLPFGLGKDDQAAERRAPAVQAEAPVRYAQASDPIQRINQLEEDNRRLNGKLEELSFQVLQLQEQLRKTQEDNEFRFQEIEGKGSAAPGKRSEAAPATAAPAAPTATAQLPARAPATATASATPPPAGAAPNGDAIGDLLG
ncbi:MAG: tol-pal system protein YbgF, partial [Variovorax sp.]